MNRSLNSLPPAALKAAMTTGTAGWGSWGSAEHHALYVQPYEHPDRRLCRCGCRKRRSHMLAANGVALASGCELSMRRALREGARKTAPALPPEPKGETDGR